MCASCVVPRASHVTSAQPLGAFPCPTLSPHCLCGCLACCIYLSSRTNRRTERPAASFSYESSISLEGAQALGRGCSQTPSHSLAAWWRQSLQGTAHLSEPVFPAVLQLLSARRQSCTLPVSLQCLSIVSGPWCLDSEVMSIATVTVWEPWGPVRVGLGQCSRRPLQ